MSTSWHPAVLERGASSLLPADLREEYLKHSASKRFGTLEEIARLVSFLCLENSYVTGRVLVADGGL